MACLLKWAHYVLLISKAGRSLSIRQLNPFVSIDSMAIYPFQIELRTAYGWTSDLGPGENSWPTVQAAMAAAEAIGIECGWDDCEWRIMEAEPSTHY
jgi:hypothetical protein